MNDLGTRLKQKRLQRGLTQAALAARMDGKTDTVRRWEHGEHTPLWPTMIRIADALDCSLDELAGRQS